MHFTLYDSRWLFHPTQEVATLALDLARRLMAFLGHSIKSFFTKLSTILALVMNVKMEVRMLGKHVVHVQSWCILSLRAKICWNQISRSRSKIKINEMNILRCLFIFTPKNNILSKYSQNVHKISFTLATCEWQSSSSYSCLCANGFSGKYCQFSDACEFQNGGCSHECRRVGSGPGNVESEGSVGVTAGDVIGRCYCPIGLTLGNDFKNCMTEQQR